MEESSENKEQSKETFLLVYEIGTNLADEEFSDDSLSICPVDLFQ